MGKKKEWENMDAKGCPYPCRTCDVKACYDKTCLAWLRWVSARWREVTEPLKRREGNER